MTGILLATAMAAPLMDVLSDELDRAVEVFGAQPEKPHYIAVSVLEDHSTSLSARSGTMDFRDDDTSRWLDVDLRVGSAALDSTHPLRGFSALEGESRGRIRLPLTEGFALRHALTRELDARYREAAEHMVVLRANQNVLVEEEASADDFEPREAVQGKVELPAGEIDVAKWEALLKAASARADRSEHVHLDEVRLKVTRERVWFLDTEGTRLEHGRLHARLAVDLSTTAEDGDQVQVFDAFDVHDPASLPTDLDDWIDAHVERLEALRKAPRGEPYSGPVVLEGRAAGVFFHEVMGHRVEGHRQKREDEGKTFAEHVGERILPEWLDVVDDPRVERMADTDLNGFYRYDDEGVPAMPATLVEDGVFRGFLMGRSPLPDVPHTNGHGRRSTGNPPSSRMGNTIVTAEKTVSRAKLREQLLKRVREQGLEYGYVVEDIEGGFALTGRMMPNAFNIRAVASWRVFADGRPDELIRGIDLVGTPFVAFSNLSAADDAPQVFNGTCGAESGWVPVSAVAPAILFDRLEFQLKEKGQDRPPLLPKPLPEDDGAAEVSE
ncbi:MAG: TldD/PmbA family protein [Alphaproteobacteria bacterium]|nr:TldD/PmbA family protein [Alphaproteobacteria bacterium]